MRGLDQTSGSLFSSVDIEERIPAEHPQRTAREIANDVLASLDIERGTWDVGAGRQSITPERLLKASLLRSFY